jgi:hypothetical protein
MDFRFALQIGSMPSAASALLPCGAKLLSKPIKPAAAGSYLEGAYPRGYPADPMIFP